MLAQSNTIARYLANQFGLVGKDAWESALADMYVDGVEDILIGKAIIERLRMKFDDLF